MMPIVPVAPTINPVFDGMLSPFAFGTLIGSTVIDLTVAVGVLVALAAAVIAARFMRRRQPAPTPRARVAELNLAA